MTYIAEYAQYCRSARPKKHHLTCRVMPSSTSNSSVNNRIPIALLLISPVSGSTAYSSALPPRFSHIWANVTRLLRVLPSTDSRYSRDDANEYRIDPGILSSHFGLGIGSLGESMSFATASVRVGMPRQELFPKAIGIWKNVVLFFREGRLVSSAVLV